MKVNRIYAKHKTRVMELSIGDVFIDPDIETQEAWMITDITTNKDTHMAVCLDSGYTTEFDFYHEVWLCNAELNISLN